MLTNPTQVSAATATDNMNSIDTSNYHSNPQATQTSAAPPLSSQGNDDFTSQAALSLTRATQTSNIVDSKAYYDISFRTSTAGVIKFIRMSFPAGTYVGAVVLVEATGIGPGTISAGEGGNTLAYTVTNAMNVPANTKIRIQIANANNPPTPSTLLTVSITTRDSANAIIDGPTSTSAYNMDQIGTGQIANGAVTTSKIANGAITSTKPAESYMKNVLVGDGTPGHAVGWDPDGVKTAFTISDPILTCSFEPNLPCSFISIDVVGTDVNHFCDITEVSFETQEFTIRCSSAPEDLTFLSYVVTTLPRNLIL
jgi:hypothetical protein